MEKLMTYGFYLSLLALFAVNIDILSLESGNQDSSSLELSSEIITSPEAVAAVSNGIVCDCSVFAGWFGFNTDCKASNWGSLCAEAGTSDCNKRSKNC